MQYSVFQTVFLIAQHNSTVLETKAYQTIIPSYNIENLGE